MPEYEGPNSGRREATTCTIRSLRTVLHGSGNVIKHYGDVPGGTILAADNGLELKGFNRRDCPTQQEEMPMPYVASYRKLTLTCCVFGLAVPAAGTTGPIAPLGSPTTFDGGCARFEVTLSGSTGITVTTVAQPTCGPVVPVISGTPTFSRSTGIVQLPIALANQGTGKFQPSVWLLGWVDSMQQVTPPPPPALSRVFQSPDSVVADNAQQFPKARIWKYDTLLRASPTQLQRLDAGRTSRPRTIKIQVASTLTKFRVQFRTRAGVVNLTVPAATPDSIPQAVWNAMNAPSNMVTGGGGIPQDVIALAFRSGASLQERQAVVDSIGGEVIGGVPVGADAWYYVRIQGDGTMTPLIAAIKKAEGMPQVEAAILALRVHLNYLAPKEGTTTGWSTWRTDPTLADGKNWAAEAVSAPLAWGCETGDSNLKIGVVDRDFRLNSDLSPNVDASSQPSYGLSPTASSHGTRVASIIAARGNNTLGMTGMMWRAKLVLQERAALSQDPATGLSQGVLKLGRNGVRVINVSAGINWSQIGHLPGDSARDSLTQKGYYLPMRQTIQMLQNEGYRPLIVLSAGNDRIQAWWNGFPATANDFPNQVIVVGGIKLGATPGQWTHYSGTNWGPLVSVMAPAGGVYTLGTSTTPDTAAGSGTSFAAPHVTGIAGLLLSTDNAMTVDTLKALIVRGAQRGGKTVLTIPVANAYESLKAAAERTGGPLCGNRIWPSGNQILVRRGTGQEVLQDVGSPVPNVSSLHGGRDLLFDWQTQALHYNGSAWAIAAPPSDTLPGGLERSVSAVSHGGDSLAYWQAGPSAVQVYLQKVTGPNPTTPRATIPISQPTGPTVCLVESSQYDASGTYLGRVCDDNRDLSTLRSPWSEDAIAQEPAIAYSPMGDEIVLAVPTIQATNHSVGPWQTCTWGNDAPPLSQRCRHVTIDQAITGTKVYGVKVSNGTVRTIWTHAGGKIYWLGIAEAAQQFATNTGTYNFTFGFFSGQSDLYLNSRARGACSFNFLDAAGQPAEPAIPVGPACYSQFGTIAPIRWAGNLKR